MNWATKPSSAEGDDGAAPSEPSPGLEANMTMLPDVAFLRWPEEAAVVAYLRTQGRLRLLLVAADADAPASSGWDEDWIRLPARDDDVRARAEALQARAALSASRPEVKADGRLFFERRWVSLSPTEEAMARLLAQRFGEVIDADALSVCAGGTLTPTAVRVHLTRLRKRIAPIGLVVRTVRSRGYVLDHAATAALPSRPALVPAPMEAVVPLRAVNDLGGGAL